MDDAIAEDVQRASLDAIVTMYALDATALGESVVYYFTQSTEGATYVQWQNVTYTPVDIEAEGFDLNAKGPLPRPKLRIGNALRIIAATVLTYDNFQGAKVTRKRTLKKYLDDQPGADPTAAFPDEVFFIDRKTAHNKRYIEWELRCLMDLEGTFLPSRQILRTCSHIYRVYVGSAFVYTAATCPFTTESAYWTALDQVTAAPAEDRCGKRLSSCKLRCTVVNGFAALPFWGFPSVARVRM